jgi:hypothetical protein
MTGSPSTTARLWPVVVGGKCLGHFLHRGKLGIEAFTAGDKSIGVFPSLSEAADALKREGAP